MRKATLGGFPQDGELWCVRWVDQLRSPEPGKVTVDVQLRRLDVQRDQFLKLPKHDAAKYLTEIPANQNDLILISVPISIIAMVPIAAVFHNGNLIGRIPLDIIRIDVPNNAGYLKKSGRKDPSPFLPPPHLWKTKYPYNTLPDRQYDLSWSSDSVLWSTPRHNSGPVVIPSYEILRSFYCFDHRIIEGLFGDHWASFIQTFVDLNRSGKNASGTLDIFLSQPLQISRSVEPLFANLVTSHAGQQGAAGLHPSLIAAHQRRGSAPIDVPLPFDWATLSLEIAGIELPGYHKFLGLEIRGVAWGGPEKIVFHGLTTEKADTGADDQDEADREKGPPVAIPQVAVTDPVAIVAGMPNSLASIYVAAQGAKWLGPPEIDHVPAARPQGAGPSPTRVTGEELTEASADFGARATGKAAQVGYAFTHSESVDPPALLFDQLAGALDDLVGRGEIQNWQPISVTEGRIFRGARAFATSDFAHGLEKGRSWSRHTSGHGRALFVAEIVRAGQLIYWLEIERRQGMTNEHFRSVVIRGPLQSPEPIVKAIMEAVRDKRGVWPASDHAVWSGCDKVQYVRHPPLDGDTCFSAENVLAAISKS